MARILIIDDDENNRELLRVRLELAGHEVTEALTGEEGLSVSGSFHPDLIFLDVMMPKMDGWQVCRLLKSGRETKTIPIVMLTACSQEIEQLRGFESGVDEYLTKPWTPEQIIATVERHLAHAKGQTK